MTQAADGIEIRVGEPADLLRAHAEIPEFADQELDPAEVARRLDATAHVLIAWQGEEPVGYKVGYDRYGDGSFYSWLGGVAPAHRGGGIARVLLDAQERHAIDAGYDRIYVKTRNRFVAMLKLLLSGGYGIVRVELPADTPIADARLTLVRVLRA
ncbi:MAG: GNAT family N-acetyltransferase [Pseudomonadota bacterium]